MPSKSTAALLDIRDNIIFAREIVGDMTVEQFAEDRMRFYAATRCLEIISEAARRISTGVTDRHPHIAWRSIMDAGNVYRHVYHGVEERIVYTTVQDALPALQAVVEAEIAAEEASE